MLSSCFSALFPLPAWFNRSSLTCHFSPLPLLLLRSASPTCLAHIQSQSAFQWIWHSEVIVYERRFSSPLRLLGSHANSPFANGDAAKFTGTNSLWHTIAWRRQLTLDQQYKMMVIEWNFDLIKSHKRLFEIALLLQIELLFCRSAWCKDQVLDWATTVNKACEHALNRVSLASLSWFLLTRTFLSVALDH